MSADDAMRADPVRPAGQGATRQPDAQSFQRPPRARHLHLGHFAFMRAVVQGLDTREAWDRYLRTEGEHDDIRNVRRTIQWIRDEFATAAKRFDRFGTARLVKIDATAIAGLEATLPTLEDFAAEHGLLEFSEAEQLEYYEDMYRRQTRRQARRARLIGRQLEALGWLERLVAQAPAAGNAAAAAASQQDAAARAPQSGDPVASWLPPDLVTHLAAAGIVTVSQLVDRINGLGLRWWSGIRAIGAVKAERIMDWLRAHEATTGLAIGAHVNVKRSHLHPHALASIVPNGTAIVPLEKFIVPAELDGSQGAYRAPRQLCRISAANDYEAILTWIRVKHGLSPQEIAALKRRRGIDPQAPEGAMEWLSYLSHTQRAYRKEAERFMLWAIVQHRKPLSSMTHDDCEAYRRFLAAPTPAEQWCGPRAREKWSPLWRPFEGPLSPLAQRQAITILKNLYKFLCDQCYLIGNPWNGMAMPKASARIDLGRSFTQAQWHFIETQLTLLPDTSANRRLRFALHLFHATGLRLAEATAATVDRLIRESRPSDAPEAETVDGWELRVIGKAARQRRVQVPQHVVGELSTYLATRGLDPNPRHPANAGAFLLGKAVDVAERAPWSPTGMRTVDPKAGIAPSTLYVQLKAFLADCAGMLATRDAQDAARLAAASTYWLRHTYGAQAYAAGTPLDVLQENLGHASLATTSIYTTSKEGRRAKVAEGLAQESRSPRRLAAGETGADASIGEAPD